MISKEEAIKRIDKDFKNLFKIKSNYSSEEVSKNLDTNYKFLIFTNFIQHSWDLNNWKDIYNFLDFYWLKLSNKDKLNFLNHHFRYYLDFFELIGNDIIKEYKTKDFFEKEIYLKLDEKDLENIRIIPTKDLTNKEFWEYFYKWYMEDFFASVYYTYYDNDLMDCRYKYDKKVIINTLSYLYSVLWDKFDINEDMFNKKQNISYIEFIISYYYVWFIDLFAISYDKKENWENFIWYDIIILPKLKNILDEIEEKRTLILDKIFDEKYNEIKIKKQNWEVSFIEWEINIYWDDTKFIELKKQYPFSKIESENHNWKTTKFKVIEKIKLKKDNK